MYLSKRSITQEFYGWTDINVCSTILLISISSILNIFYMEYAYSLKNQNKTNKK